MSVQLHPLAQMTTQTPTPACWTWQLLWGGRGWTQNVPPTFLCGGRVGTCPPLSRNAKRGDHSPFQQGHPKSGPRRASGFTSRVLSCWATLGRGAKDTWLLTELFQATVPSDLAPNTLASVVIAFAAQPKKGRGATPQPAQETEISESPDLLGNQF